MSRTTTRGQDGHTTTLIPCRPPHSIVVQPPSPPPLLHHNYGANDGTRSKYLRGVAIPSTRETAALQNNRGTSIATSLSTYPSHPDAGGALSRETTNSGTRQAAARADDGVINILVSPHLPCATPERPPLPLRYCPPPSKPAPSKHPTSTIPLRQTSFNVRVPPHRPMRLSARDPDARAAHPQTESNDRHSGIGR
ncbi:hypothetical protein GGF50DRAFT_121352 [Schizophyllum commune]